ncbi:ribonuclease H-like protein, partial [Saccharata proteae CBS 121410]
YWSHKQFKGPEGQDVTVEYCKTLEQSEAAAKKFLNEKVLGFDMEWSSYPSANIKLNISVVQLACADRIAVFHIAQHSGTTVDRVLAPSLRKIIESPEYIKTGVNILGADGARLEHWFRLKPQGLFELSHLWRLIRSERAAVNGEEESSRKLRAMAAQVSDQLGSPLLKDSVRTSDWTKPLTQKQIDYAAADAYAGFMLFHVMNEKRKLMKPAPPLPAFAELKQPIIHRLGPRIDGEGKKLKSPTGT